jgi:hypothetical protein
MSTVVIVCATVYVLDHTIGIIRVTTSGSSVVRTLKHPPYRLVVERAVQCSCSKAVLVDPEVHTKDKKCLHPKSVYLLETSLRKDLPFAFAGSKVKHKRGQHKCCASCARIGALGEGFCAARCGIGIAL